MWDLNYFVDHSGRLSPPGLWVRSVLDVPEAPRSSDCGAPEQGSDTGEVEEVGRLCGNMSDRCACLCVTGAGIRGY